MPVFTDALIGDTTHLSTEEFGAYCLILMATWNNHGQPFADDDARMARVCRMALKRWRLKRPVLAPFFDLSSSFWRQKRLEKEWAKVQMYVAQKATAGKASALKRNNPQSTAVAEPYQRGGQRNGNGEATPNPIPIEEESKEDSEATPLPAKQPAADPVKEVFDRGAVMLGKDRRSLLGKFCKTHGEVAVLEAIVACETERPIDPISFFVGCMSRAPPKNGNGHAKQSPVTNLYEGAMRAADKLDREEADRLAGLPPALPFLDSQRSH